MTKQPTETETRDNAGASSVIPAWDSLPDLMNVLDIGDEYLWNPERLVPFEHWVGHIPFAFWIMKVLKPRAFAELGTHRGNSYCAMCQAIATLRLDSVGSAIDTWQGDLHMAAEGGLLADLQSHHDRRYGAFSTLLPMTFDAARDMFSDGHIDLLHIDGTHTYEAVRHDFENWLPVLSDRGVVLFHDINVRKDDFGVWRVWEELSARYPSFSFTHSHGLGVLGVGSELPDALRRLFAMASNPQATARIRALFASRGDALVGQLLLSQSDVKRDQVLAEALEHDAALRAEAEAVAGAKAAQLEAARQAETAAELNAIRAEAARREVALRAELASALNAGRAEVVRRNEASALKIAIATAQREITLRAQATAALQEALARTEHQEKQSAALRHATAAANAQLDAMQQSTMWRALSPGRAVLRRMPAGVRRFTRRALKLGWWTVTLQLPRRLKARLNARSV